MTNRYSVLYAIFMLSLPLFAQNTPSPAPIIAGSMDGLIPGNKVVVMDQPALPFGEFAAQSTDLDLNYDSIPDVTFSLFMCNSFDCVQSSSMVGAVHPGFTFVVGPQFPHNHAANDSIKANSNWESTVNGAPLGVLSSQGTGFNGPQSSGEWLNNSFGYLGFRLVTPAADTLLGWIYIHTSTQGASSAHLEVLAWGIQLDPVQKPVVQWSILPEKTTYCAGDSVTFSANVWGANDFTWHFWDGTIANTPVVTKVLPAASVSAQLTATNANGTVTLTSQLPVSQIQVVANDLLINCTTPTGTLSASANQPATFYWVVGADTTTTPPNLAWISGLVQVIAVDFFGCADVDTLDIVVDTEAPNVDIEASGNFFIAHSSTPNVTYYWQINSNPNIIPGNQVEITTEGVYTVVVTAPNGCTQTASAVVIMGTTEASNLNINVLPNPANDFITLENKENFTVTTAIFDISGKQRLSLGATAPEQKNTFDISQLPAGFYWMNGYDDNGKWRLSRKIVKM